MAELSVAGAVPNSRNARTTAPSPPRLVRRGWGVLSRLLDPVALLGIAGAVGLWYAIAAIVEYVPFPHEVFENALQSLFSSTYLPAIGLPRGGYFPHLMFTLRNVALGFSLGAVIGIVIGLLAAESRVVDKIANPVVSLLGTVPIVVAAPFFLIWFGITPVSQIALVGFYTAIVLQLFAFRAATNQPVRYAEYAATLGLPSRIRFFKVRMPGTLPEVFGGLRIALASSWGLAAVTEMLGASFGTGRVIVALRSVYDLTGILTVVILLGIIAIVMDGLLMAARAYALRWAPTGRSST